MAPAGDSGMNWERIAVELRTHREAQRNLWGDLDDMTVTRFLAGTCNAAERESILDAMRHYPAVREWVEGLQDIMGTPETSGGRADGVVPREAGIKIWRSLQGGLELVDELVVRVADGASLLGHGLQRHLISPTAVTLAQHENAAVVWQGLSLVPFDAQIALTCSRAKGSPSWLVMLEFTSSQPQSEFMGRCLTVIESEATGECEIQLALRECVSQPIRLGDGRWRVRLMMDDQSWQILLDLGGDRGNE